MYVDGRVDGKDGRDVHVIPMCYLPLIHPKKLHIQYKYSTRYDEI